MANHYFLNIDSSLKALPWHFALDEYQDEQALGFEQKFGIKQHIARLLIARNVEESMLFEYLNPSLRAYMFDPLTLCDMNKAASRIIKAIEKKENIVIYGDYDVDGACSAALLANFLKFYDLDAKIYIPDRLSEGYGLNCERINRLIDEGAQCIITVDCGANHLPALQRAKLREIDVVVLDHHQMSQTHDSAYALVNPNRPDDMSGQGHLCGAGVVFSALVEICRQLKRQGRNVPDLITYLDLVAFATICDVVPLIGVNRAFVTTGLKMANQTKNIGLAALIDSANIHAPLNSFHFGYILGPRVNAGGRIGDQALGAKLLSIKDGTAAKQIAEQLTILNHERQDMEKLGLEEAEQAVNFNQNGEVPPFIIVANEKWHPGIVGLIAARLKEKYYRPSIVFSIKKDGKATGSARSIEGFDVGAAIRKANDEGILLSGGGHMMAAGLTLLKENLPQLMERFCAAYGTKILDLGTKRKLIIEGMISANALTVDFCQELEQVGPYGSGNKMPCFVIPNVTLASAREVGNKHLQLNFVNANGGKVKAMAFGEADSDFGYKLRKDKNTVFHIAGTLGLNYWQGRVTPQFILKDAAFAKK